jgi:hypothetical protein
MIAQIVHLPQGTPLCDRRKANSPSDHSIGCSKTAKTAAPDGVNPTTGRLTTVNYGTEDRVTPEPYFPEVVELAREYINTSIRHLEYQEVRRLVHCSMGCYG